MEEKSNATLEKIHEAAMAEFLDKGFQGASLRRKKSLTPRWKKSMRRPWPNFWTRAFKGLLCGRS